MKKRKWAVVKPLLSTHYLQLHTYIMYMLFPVRRQAWVFSTDLFRLSNKFIHSCTSLHSYAPTNLFRSSPAAYIHCAMFVKINVIFIIRMTHILLASSMKGGLYFMNLLKILSIWWFIVFFLIKIILILRHTYYNINSLYTSFNCFYLFICEFTMCNIICTCVRCII